MSRQTTTSLAFSAILLFSFSCSGQSTDGDDSSGLTITTDGGTADDAGPTGDGGSTTVDGSDAAADDTCVAGRRRCAGNLVQRCGDDNRDGELAWEMFRDCADRSGCTDGACTDPLHGFADEPTRWRLPTGYRPSDNTGFTLLNQQRADQLVPEDWLWSTTDLTGDGWPDLVVTGELVEQGRDERVRAFGQEGEHHWKVFPGGDEGFAPAPIEWPLPEGGAGNRSFSHVSYTSYYGPAEFPDTEGFQFWWIGDLVGDDTLDLVVTAEVVDGDLSTFESDDGRYWKVYEGGTEGFAASPTPWSLPEGPVGQHAAGFWWRSKLAIDSLTPHWTTRDFTGDGNQDLIVTSRAVSEDDFTPRTFRDEEGRYWKIYRWTPSGFADEPLRWRLPEIPHDQYRNLWSTDFGVSYVVDPGDSQSNRFWRTGDFDGDGYWDLAVTRKIDPGESAYKPVGDPDTPQWKVYRGGPEGFAQEAELWRLPNGAEPASFVSSGQLVLESMSSGKSVAFAVTHTSGDESSTVFGYDEGNPHWRVYDLGPDGFTEGPREWSVPTKPRGASGGFFAWNNDPAGAMEQPPDGAQRWTTFSMTRRAGLDLVVMAEFRDGSASTPREGEDQYWKLYRAVP